MFKLIKDRWNAYTPGFFKKIVHGGCGIGGFGMLCIPFSSYLPIRLQDVPGYLIAVGVTSAGIAKLTKQDGVAKAESDAFLNSGAGATAPPTETK
jgi:hypothetical protein